MSAGYERPTSVNEKKKFHNIPDPFDVVILLLPASVHIAMFRLVRRGELLSNG